MCIRYNHSIDYVTLFKNSYRITLYFEDHIFPIDNLTIKHRKIVRTLTPTFCMEYTKINIFFISYFSPFGYDFDEKVNEKYIPPQ